MFFNICIAFFLFGPLFIIILLVICIPYARSVRGVFECSDCLCVHHIPLNFSQHYYNSVYYTYKVLCIIIMYLFSHLSLVSYVFIKYFSIFLTFYKV